MTPGQSLWVHWYFHVPNYLLAALTYTLIGRFILSLVLDSDTVIVRVFSQITNPVLKAVAAITPKIVPAGLIIIFAIVWLFVLRIAWFFGLRMLGLGPTSIS
jgi:YggT family protein